MNESPLAAEILKGFTPLTDRDQANGKTLELSAISYTPEHCYVFGFTDKSILVVGYERDQYEDGVSMTVHAVALGHLEALGWLTPDQMKAVADDRKRTADAQQKAWRRQQFEELQKEFG